MAALTRGLVLASLWLAVAAGVWPLRSAPGALAGALAILAGSAGLARLRPQAAVGLVFAFAYVSYGVVRLVAGPGVASVPFFLAAFVGLVVGLVPWTRWEARPGWRMPLAWWALGVAVTWPWVAAREFGPSFDASPATGLIVTTALVQLSLPLWMDRLLADGPSPVFHAVRRGDAEPRLPWHVWLTVSALATSIAALYQQWVDLAWLSGEPWTRLGRAVGLMGDANPMGVAAATWAPLTVLAFGTSRLAWLAGGLTSVPVWLGAWTSGARTTVILLAAGLCGLALTWTSARGWRRGRVLTVAVGLGVVALGLVMAVGPRLPEASPVGRLVANLSLSDPRATAYELFWHRNGYGSAAMAAVRDHPWMGVGVGRFWSVSQAYAQGLGLTIPPDNAQNLWRQSLVEQGILGVLPILWLTGLTAAALLRGRVEGSALLTRFMVAGLGASLVVGYPVQDPAIAVTLATLVCAVVRGEGSQRMAAPAPSSRSAANAAGSGSTVSTRHG